MSKVSLEDGVNCWTFSSTHYVYAAVNNVEKYFKTLNQALPKKVSVPFNTGYRTEIDISKELPQSEASYFQSLIGILRWIVELSWIDIEMEVLMMSSITDMPWKGHLEQLFHIFAYLKQRYNSEIVLDATAPDFHEALFLHEDWRYTPHSEAKEAYTI